MAAHIIPKLNKVPEDDVAGQISPSLIPGHEFDMPISHSTHPEILHPSSTPPDTLNPQPRGTIASSRRPRPLSMPPQSFTANNPVVAVNSAVNNNTDVSDSKDRSHDENSQRRKHREDSSKPSRSNRILGDYTLSKTLGAGSMGKVKLATHNITGEKVCGSYCSLRLITSSYTLFLYSWLLKSFLESTLIHRLQPTAQESTMTPQHVRPPKMPPRRFGHFAKPPFLCFSITPTYVACER